MRVAARLVVVCEMVESVERWGVAARLMAGCEMRGMRRAMVRGGAIGGGLRNGWNVGDLRAFCGNSFDASNKI